MARSNVGDKITLVPFPGQVAQSAARADCSCSSVGGGEGGSLAHR